VPAASTDAMVPNAANLRMGASFDGGRRLTRLARRPLAADVMAATLTQRASLRVVGDYVSLKTRS
jgi:hypothetical protein